MKPLAGVKVLDLSKVLAGPLCTQILADMGADVIKVEPVEGGDETRLWPPFAAPGFGAVFLSVNRNKRSIALDLKSEAGRKIVHQLAREADVALESFGAGVAERLGVDAARLRAINPRLIHCSISGFGKSGPLKDWPGYDMVLQAFSGMMAMTGDETSDNLRSPISPIDQATGSHAATGILAALFARTRSNEGAALSVSLFETAVGLMRGNVQSYWLRGVQPPKSGRAHESLCPYTVYEAADGPILIGTANNNLWRKLCGVLGLEAYVDDPKFRTNPDRVAHRGETDALVGAALAKKPVQDWIAALSAAKVPCAPVNSLQQLLDEAHTKASGVVLDYELPGVGPAHAVALPINFDGAAREAGAAPPRHGEHSDAILRDLGYTDAQIQDLRADRAIA